LVNLTHEGPRRANPESRPKHLPGQLLPAWPAGNGFDGCQGFTGANRMADERRKIVQEYRFYTIAEKTNKSKSVLIQKAILPLILSYTEGNANSRTKYVDKLLKEVAQTAGINKLVSITRPDTQLLKIYTNTLATCDWFPCRCLIQIWRRRNGS
jgi:hypothetical protein